MLSTAKSRYVIEPLRKDWHDRAQFSCGIESLDRYLKEQADQDRKRKIAAPFVLIEKDQPPVLGYYTLSALSIHLEQLPSDVAQKLPRYPEVPATLLGRLAVHQECRGQRLGEFLLLDALYRSCDQSEKVASFAVVVDAIDESARNFYLHFGFISFPERFERLFLPMKTIEQLR
jgi:predicted GNAT family N-acyltransferase